MFNLILIIFKILFYLKFYYNKDNANGKSQVSIEENPSD
jgi:hypothetical protein